MESTHSSSMIATPLTVNGEVRGVVLLTHAKPHYFPMTAIRLLQALTSHIGLAIGNAFLHAEVRRMANRDMLTELYARHYLDEMIHECQNRDFAVLSSLWISMNSSRSMIRSVTSVGTKF